jgi:long-chain fatty acid transport protein
MNIRLNRAVGAATAAALTLAAGTTHASGFAVPEVSTAGLGVSNAIVADYTEPGAFAYNPAAMGFHDRSSLSAGALFVYPDFSVETAAGDFDSEGASWVVIPLLQGNYVVNERWRLGLSVNAPFGLETRWKLGTFPPLSLPLGPFTGLDHPTQSKLEVIAASPTATYRVNEALSLSAGIDYYNAMEATLNTYASELTGDGDGWGWNLGALYVHGPWSLGAAFRSGTTIEIDGWVSSPLGSERATVDLDLPWRLQLGVRYQIRDDLAMELDWTRTGWSAFEELVVKARNGAALKTDINRWENTNAWRLGLTYDLREGTRLRFGYTYDETGQEDEHFSGRVPDNDRHLFSVGVGQNLGDGWSLDAGYMYVHFKERKYRGDAVYVPIPPGQPVNGTNAIDGDYQAAAHLLGLEVRKTF